MELVNIFIVASAVVVILLLWIVVGVRHLKHLKKDVYDQWELVDQNLRKRQDLVPNLIETVRMYDQSQEELIERFIKERQTAARLYIPGAKKIEYEHDLSITINKIMDLCKENHELARDTNFLEIRKEINDLEENAIEKTNQHNKMVRSYNNHRKSLLLLPLATVFGYDQLNIFEVEN